MSNQKPKHFLVLKIVGIVGAALVVVGIILIITGFGNFEVNNFMIGGFLLAFGMMAGFFGLIGGFAPEIAKMRAKSVRYIQEESKDDLTSIANTSAEITSGAVSTTVRAVKEGLADTKFCKYCGAKIDVDSKFCSACGKQV